MCKSNNLTASYNCLSRKRIASEQKEGLGEDLRDLLSCPCKPPHTQQMGHPATTKRDKALQGIQQDPELSDSSKHTYAQRLMAMSAKLGQAISELAMQPMTILP